MHIDVNPVGRWTSPWSAWKYTGAILDAFHDDDMFAVVFGVPKSQDIPWPHRVSYFLKVWTECLDPSKRSFVAISETGAILGYSRWALGYYEPIPISWWPSHFLQRIVNFMADWYNKYLDLLGIAPHPQRPSLRLFWNQLEATLPAPSYDSKWLDLVAVRREVQGQNVGTRLLEVGLELLSEYFQGRTLFLYASKNGEALYNRLGFTSMGSTTLYVENTSIYTALMVRKS